MVGKFARNLMVEIAVWVWLSYDAEVVYTECKTDWISGNFSNVHPIPSRQMRVLLYAEP